MTIKPKEESSFTTSRPATGDQSRSFDLGEAEVFHGVWYDEHGKLTDFCLEQRITIEGESAVVTRIDCCHGEVHVHRFHTNGDEEMRRVIRRIERQEDVEYGYQVAESLLYDHWETYMIEWKRGL